MSFQKFFKRTKNVVFRSKKKSTSRGSSQSNEICRLQSLADHHRHEDSLDSNDSRPRVRKYNSLSSDGSENSTDDSVDFESDDTSRRSSTSSYSDEPSLNEDRRDIFWKRRSENASTPCVSDGGIVPRSPDELQQCVPEEVVSTATEQLLNKLEIYRLSKSYLKKLQIMQRYIEVKELSFSNVGTFNIRMLVLFCEEDEEIGKVFITHLKRTYPNIDVFNIWEDYYGCITPNYWEHVIDSTSYVFILLSHAFLRFARQNGYLQMALEEMNNCRYIKIIPIYLENVTYSDYEWLFDFHSFKGIHAFDNRRVMFEYLLHFLKMDVESKIARRYSTFSLYLNTLPSSGGSPSRLETV